MRVSVSLVTAWPLLVSTLYSQAPGTSVSDLPPGNPSFEVASVRPNTTGSPVGTAGGAGGASVSRLGQRVTAVNAPLRDIIRYAYELESYQMIEGNLPVLDERFDITAIVPESSSSPDQSRAMLRSLLAERFQLSARVVPRERPVYSLTLARRDGRLGSSLTRSAVDCDAWRAARQKDVEAPGGKPALPEDIVRALKPMCDMVFQPFRARIYGGARPISDVALILSRLPALGPVVDRTGLTGVFDFELTFAPLRAGGSAGEVPQTDLPTIFVAVQEQLGLKLETDRGPVNALVVDRVARPTPN